MSVERGIKGVRRGWQHDRRAAFVGLLLTIMLIMAPSLGAPPMVHDSFWIDIVWTDQFARELASGNPYPRWLPLSHGGLGSPVFYYYPPLAFYLAGAAQLTGLTPYGAVIAAFVAAFLLSGIGAYLWLERYRHPVIGMILFVAAPYHVADFVYRGALAESLGVAILPFLAIGLRRVAEGRGIAFAAVAYAALIAAHLPLALLTSLFFIAPYALWNRDRLAGFAIGAALGIGMAAIYLLPALALDVWRDSGRLYVLPLLRPGPWTVWNAEWDEFAVRATFTCAAALALSLVAAWYWSRSRWALGGLTAIALAVGLIPFVWDIPLLAKVQFPYRLLPVAELALATAVAQIADWRRAALTIALPLLLSAGVNRPPRPLHTPGFFLEGHRDVAEYLPRGAQGGTPIFPTPAELRERAEPLPVRPGWVVKPLFYFPAWRCAVPEPVTKLIMHRPDCEPELVRLPIEKTGFVISLAALVLLLLSRIFARKPLQKRKD